MNLYELVSRYDRVDYHRTGSSSESETEQWLCEVLESIGADIEYYDYRYHHYAARAEVRIDGRPVLSMPLYYEAIGSVQQSRNVTTGSVDIGRDENKAYALIQQLAAQAKEKGRDALIIATRCENDLLYALNVSPVLKNNLPVILLPGSEADNLERADIVLDFSAILSEKASRNILAHFGTSSLKDTLVITTPITGWFSCTGERGTGIAIAIDLANQLGQRYPVSLELTTGHELGYLGGFAYTNSLEAGPRAVIHIGSCVGAAQARLKAYSNLPAQDVGSIDSISSSIAAQVTHVEQPLETTNWVGEAECWTRFGCPMLSIAGDNAMFHTPEDRLPAATSPELLEETAEVLLHVGRQMMEMPVNTW